MVGYVCKKEHDNKFYYDEMHTGKNFLVRLIVIVLGMITFFSYMYHYTLVIKFYTPVHVIFSFPDKISKKVFSKKKCIGKEKIT